MNQIYSTGVAPPKEGIASRLRKWLLSIRGGIRIRIALYFLLAGTTIIILGLLLTNMFGMQTVRQTIGANFQEMAWVTARSIAFKFESELRHLDDLAKNPQVVSNISIANAFYKQTSDKWVEDFITKREREWHNGTGGQDAEVMENDVSKYLRTLVEMRKETVLGICITDGEGALLASSSRPLHFDLRGTPWWKSIKSGHSAYISDFLNHGTIFQTEGWIVEITLPIYRKQQIAGAIHIAFMATPMFSMVREIRIGQTGHAMIIDETGTPQLCPILPPKAHIINGELLKTINSDEADWSIVANDAHGSNNSIIGFAPVQIGGRFASDIAGWKHWHTFIRQDPQETYASLHAMLWKVGWEGLVLVILLALSGLFIGRQIEKPLQTLQRGARLIGSGDLQHRIDLRLGDEIGLLATEFNSMAENILRARNELVNFANAVTYAGDSIIITDLKGMVFYVNPAFEELTGFTADEAKGETPKLWKSNQNLESTYKNIWDTVLDGRIWVGEIINKKKNGELYHAQMTVSPIRNEQGKIVNLLGVQRDVTEQRRMEAELRRHHNELETLVKKRTIEISRAKDEIENLLESANDVIFTVDSKGCFLFVNTQVETWGYKKADIIGKPFSTILAKKDMNCMQDCSITCQSSDLVQGKLLSTKVREFCIQTVDGIKRKVMISVSGLAGGNILVIMRDMAEIEQLQRRITDSEKMRAIGEMATMLAHDFRNPLSTVKMNLQILSRKADRKSPEDKEHFKLALSEVATLEHLLSSMLDFAKPMSINFEWNDLHRDLDNAVHCLEYILKDKQILLTKNFNAENSRTCTDRGKMNQIWNNLLLNAIQAMPSGGKLSISSSNECYDGEQWITVRIKDDGSGIPEDVQKRIFDPFFTMRSDGTGLGLAIVKKIVDGHHGKISVESEDGSGTTFLIALQVRHFVQTGLDGETNELEAATTRGNRQLI